LIFQVNSPYPEILSIVKKYEKLSDEIASENFFKNMLEELLSKFSNSEFSIMQQYHKNISIATGINVGLITTDFKQKSVYRLLEKFYYKTKLIEQEVQDSTDLTKQPSIELVNNECRNNLLSYLKVIFDYI
jgi:phosphoenolpyruvate carboxylase